jgi:hypothetical protein
LRLQDKTRKGKYSEDWNKADTLPCLFINEQTNKSRCNPLLNITMLSKRAMDKYDAEEDTTVINDNDFGQNERMCTVSPLCCRWLLIFRVCGLKRVRMGA